MCVYIYIYIYVYILNESFISYVTWGSRDGNFLRSLKPWHLIGLSRDYQLCRLLHSEVFYYFYRKKQGRKHGETYDKQSSRFVIAKDSESQNGLTSVNTTLTDHFLLLLHQPIQLIDFLSEL